MPNAVRLFVQKRSGGAKSRRWRRPRSLVCGRSLPRRYDGRKRSTGQRSVHHNGLGFTRAVTAGKSLHYKTNYKARMAAADQPRKRRRVEALVSLRSDVKGVDYGLPMNFAPSSSNLNQNSGFFVSSTIIQPRRLNSLVPPTTSELSISS